MIRRYGVHLPEARELPALPKGVVLHWTGGGHKANDVDTAAYHYVVEADGTVRSGVPVNANVRQLGPADTYAMHTGGWNSYRVGVAVAGMRGYQSPASPGDQRINELQINRMLSIAAHFLEVGGLNPIDPRHLCSHLEVWTIHGVKGGQNHTKQDIGHLPFRPDLKRHEVGYYLRELTGKIMSPEPEVVQPVEGPPPVDLSNLRLDKIDRPTRDHVAGIVRARRVEPSDVFAGVSVAVDLLRAVAKARGSGFSMETITEVADALSEWKARP